MAIERANKKVLIVSLTENGAALGRRLYHKIAGEFQQVTCASKAEWRIEDREESVTFPLGPWLGQQFRQYDFIIAIMATGIVVRSIAPYLQDKTKDPGLVVCDEGGQYAISLLSGHIGNANEMAQIVAAHIGALPVITTASDVQQKKAVDMLAMENHLLIGDMVQAKEVTASLVNHQALYLYDPEHYVQSEHGYILLDDKAMDLSDHMALVYVGHHKEPRIRTGRMVQLIPQDIVIGLGFRKEKASAEIIEKIEKTLMEHNIDARSINSIATVPIKAEQQAYQEVIDYFGCQAKVVAYEAIQEVQDLFEQSPLVLRTLGVGGVSEPCAYLVSNKGQCLMHKEKIDGVTLSIYQKKKE